MGCVKKVEVILGIIFISLSFIAAQENITCVFDIECENLHGEGWICENETCVLGPEENSYGLPDAEILELYIDSLIPTYSTYVLKDINKELYNQRIEISAKIMNSGDVPLNNLEFKIEIPEIEYDSHHKIPLIKKFWAKVLNLFTKEGRKDINYGMKTGVFTQIEPGRKVHYVIGDEQTIWKVTGGKELTRGMFESPGEYTLKITLDPRERIYESNEENNVLITKFEVLELPSAPELYSQENMELEQDKMFEISSNFRENIAGEEETISECQSLSLKEFQETCLLMMFGSLISQNKTTSELENIICPMITIESIKENLKSNDLCVVEGQLIE